MDGARPTPWERLRRIDGRIWDGGIAAAVATILLTDLWLERGTSAAASRYEPVAAAALAIAGVALYWRRRRPLASIATVTLASFLFGVLHQPNTAPVLGLPLAIASYSAAAYLERSRAQFVAFVAAFLASAILQSDGNANWLEMAVNGGVTVGVAVAIGRMTWNRRRRIERERDLAAHEAVTAERDRIARELHDVVAHSMSVMVVQAGGARAVLRRDPDAADDALRAIEEAGRTGLAEMRRLLGSEGQEGRSLGPQPGLERLDELLQRMRATGLPVELVVEGEARRLSMGMDVSAYRIVQEALTNTLKHAGNGARARVAIRYGEGTIDVEVADDGRGPMSSANGAGRGIIGMRERVALFHGELRSGAKPGGGFVIHARMPLDANGSS